MARISLILCDLCKEKISKEDDGAFEISLIQNVGEGNLLAGEICAKCHASLTARLLSTEKLNVRSPQQPAAVRKTARDLLVEKTAEDLYEAPEAPIGPTKEEKAGRKPTSDLLEDELVQVPSLFDLKRANKVVDILKGGCPHHFKSWADGRVTCGPAPDGFQGALASTRGCGKILTAAEY